ncbi:MAG: cysteine desulfurase family protein [Gemmataceae bacterium]
MMTPIYLDHNASSPLLPEAAEAMRAVWMEAGGNPASAHHAGRKARQRLEDARERVAAALGASPDEVIFTSGATEANNLALFGLTACPSPPLRFGRGRGRGHACQPAPELAKSRKRVEGDNPTPRPPPRSGEWEQNPGHLLAAPIEHPCVIEPLNQLAAVGFAVEWLPVTPRGQVEQRQVLARVRDDTRLVALMLANHETGAIQPVRHVTKTLPKGIPLHCDAAQAVGKIPVNFRDLGVTTLTASAHKFGGPPGVGLLLLKRDTKLTPRAFGGHQQRGHRPGTEPVALAVGLATALDHAVTHLDANRAKLDELRQRLLDRLQAVGPVVNGPQPGDPDGLPTTLNLSFPGCRADVLLMALDLAGVACSAGSACSSGSLLPSPVLRAMGVPDEGLRSAVRFSLGPSLTEADVDDAAGRITRCVQDVRGRGT